MQYNLGQSITSWIVCSFSQELHHYVEEYVNVYEADDDEEWRLVISEVTAFMEVRLRPASLLLDNPRQRTQTTERTSRGERRLSPLLFRSVFYVLFLTTMTIQYNTIQYNLYLPSAVFIAQVLVGPSKQLKHQTRIVNSVLRMRPDTKTTLKMWPKI